MTDAIRATATLHLESCPGETRTFDQLVAHYQGIADNSPFGPIVRMMEATPDVIEMRLRRERAEREIDATIAKQERLVRCLGLTFPYILRHYGVRSNVRIDLSRVGRVRIWVSVTEHSSNYSIDPYLDKTIDDFLVWFDLNVQES